MKIDFRCRDAFGKAYYQTVELPDGAEQCVGKAANGARIFIGDYVGVEGTDKKYRVCMKGFAFAEDGCYLCESQLKNSRKIENDKGIRTTRVSTVS